MEKIKYNDYTIVYKIPFTEIDRIDLCLCNQPKETLESFYKRQNTKPDLLINGGFFGLADGGTCFNYVDEKETIHATDLYKWGIGIVDAKDIKYGSLNGRTDWRDFISGYPNLIDNYQVVPITFAKEINYNARRSILAFDPNYLFVIAVDLPGMNFAAMQNMLVDLNVQYAINLDGGGSTRILDKGQLVTAESYSRPVDNVVAVYYTKEEKKILYRVQTGAYRQRENAEDMLNKVKALGGIYTGSYIKKVDGLFKVQSGAFSIRENAEKMQKDLKEKGFNCFITTK